MFQESDFIKYKNLSLATDPIQDKPRRLYDKKVWCFNKQVIFKQYYIENKYFFDSFLQRIGFFKKLVTYNFEYKVNEKNIQILSEFIPRKKVDYTKRIDFNAEYIIYTNQILNQDVFFYFDDPSLKNFHYNGHGFHLIDESKLNFCRKDKRYAEIFLFSTFKEGLKTDIEAELYHVEDQNKLYSLYDQMHASIKIIIENIFQ